MLTWFQMKFKAYPCSVDLIRESFHSRYKAARECQGLHQLIKGNLHIISIFFKNRPFQSQLLLK